MCFNRVSPSAIRKQNDKVRFDYISTKIHTLIRKNTDLLDELMSIETESYPSWWDGLPEQRYKYMMEMMMGIFQEVPKPEDTAQYECVEGWGKEDQKAWFFWADVLEKDNYIWTNLIPAINENDYERAQLVNAATDSYPAPLNKQ
tara:strand:- start:381 stop:815 length:435 start_codon:yes stop_codon:yes gene_type:complete